MRTDAMTAPRAMHASMFPARAICRFLRVRSPTLVIPTTMTFCSYHPRLGLTPLLFFHIRFPTTRVVWATRIQIRLHQPLTAASQSSQPMLHSAPYDRFPKRCRSILSTMTNRVPPEVMPCGSSMRSLPHPVLVFVSTRTAFLSNRKCRI